MTPVADPLAIVGNMDDPLSTDAAASGLARPKSRIFTVPFGVSLILAGFRSRCTIPRSWAAVSPSAICLAISTASSHLIGPLLQPVRQGLAVDELHDDAPARAQLLESVHVSNVGVIQRGEKLRFAL